MLEDTAALTVSVVGYKRLQLVVRKYVLMYCTVGEDWLLFSTKSNKHEKYHDQHTKQIQGEASCFVSNLVLSLHAVPGTAAAIVVVVVVVVVATLKHELSIESRDTTNG